jgi:hypothetical protein
MTPSGYTHNVLAVKASPLGTLIGHRFGAAADGGRPQDNCD